MNSPLEELRRLGQSVWYDNIRRGMITSGELQRLIDQGVSGLTSNPTIFEKAIAGSTDYDEELLDMVRDGKNAQEIYDSFTVEDVRSAADLLRPHYDRSDGADGYASLEVSPHLAHETDMSVAEAKRLFATLDRPNVMVKVPATPEGIPAIRRLIGEGININVTLIFSLEAYGHVMEAYISGLEDLAAAGGDVSTPASVASFFVSRVDTTVDPQLDKRMREGAKELGELMGKAAIANAKLAYRAFESNFSGERFARLSARGARRQRPLWGSTSTKNPAYSDVMYVESLIGPDTVNTMPPATITAFMEHGRAEATLARDVDDAERTFEQLASAGISMEQVTGKLLADGVKSFADSYDKLLANIEEKRAGLIAREHRSARADLGVHTKAVEEALHDFERRDLAARIWRHDHTVWKPDPAEISDRLGWLNVTDMMSEQVPALESFAGEVRDAGFRHVVLLGMGGSSLGPEVLRQTFGSAKGYPELIVLDSTLPASVRAVGAAIDPRHTLFLASSKSGATVEPLAFYKHFRGLVEQAVGKDPAGQSFVAITDPGTSLEAMARERGFRRVFLNPPDIGGRYSVLSYFGLVPAALTGIDIQALLRRADSMRQRCAAGVPTRENPGLWLGAAMGALAAQGRDKLTLVTSPSIGSFGLWVEQLIAESTGKEGKGIVPVAGEPLVDSSEYGDERLFVYLRLEGDDNAASDGATESVKSSGHPVVRLELRDKHDLGAEFFRWEFATAVAGAILGIQPFDQPDVQAAKDETSRVLQEYQASGRPPRLETLSSVGELLSKPSDGDYLAIMAYVRQTPEADRMLADLRGRVLERYRLATTLGYGPRFLHSTGQLHKGGPDSGLFLQVTADRDEDVDIPGEPYTFGVLADAQAMGDLLALQALGRRVARVHMGADGEVEIGKLAD